MYLAKVENEVFYGFSQRRRDTKRKEDEVYWGFSQRRRDAKRKEDEVYFSALEGVFPLQGAKSRLLTSESMIITHSVP